MAALDRHLREKGNTFSISKDQEFEASCEVLNGKAIELQEQGLGERKHRADPVTKEEELLWSQQVLGADTSIGSELEVCPRPLYWYIEYVDWVEAKLQSLCGH